MSAMKHFSIPNDHIPLGKASQSLEELKRMERNWSIDKLENKKAWNRLRLKENDFY